MPFPMVFYKNVELRPLGDKIVVTMIDQDRKTANGLVLPANDRERPILAKVLAVGVGRLSPIPLKKGDEVVLERYAGTEIRPGAKAPVVVVTLDDIMAVVKPAKSERVARCKGCTCCRERK